MTYLDETKKAGVSKMIDWINDQDWLNDYTDTVVEEITVIISDVVEATKRHAATLTGKEIRDLAKYAGFEISKRTRDERDFMETEYVISPCPEKGIEHEGESGKKHYKNIASILEYPEEGCCPLGDEIIKQFPNRY